MIDCLVAMVDELRAARPRIYDAAAFRPWLLALREAVRALPRFDQRWATVAMLADDLAREMAGAPLSLLHGWLVQQILTEADQAQLVRVVAQHQAVLRDEPRRTGRDC